MVIDRYFHALNELWMATEIGIIPLTYYLGYTINK